jgi:hypothetical protein
MRSLAQPRVLLHATYGAVITTLACYPRLAIWLDRPYTTFYSCVMVLWTTFILWAFVFAWQPKYARRPVTNFQCPRGIWIIATVYGVIGAVLLRIFMDPQLRLTTPKDYPADWHSWIAMCLFVLAMDTLLFCFAPYAFFMRLLRRPDISLALTVMFGIFVQVLKINSFRPWPPAMLIVELVVVHVIGGFMSVYLYIKGGTLPVWWAVFLLQLRQAYDLMTG